MAGHAHQGLCHQVRHRVVEQAIAVGVDDDAVALLLQALVQLVHALRVLGATELDHRSPFQGLGRAAQTRRVVDVDQHEQAVQRLQGQAPRHAVDHHPQQRPLPGQLAVARLQQLRGLIERRADLVDLGQVRVPPCQPLPSGVGQLAGERRHLAQRLQGHGQQSPEQQRDGDRHRQQHRHRGPDHRRPGVHQRFGVEDHAQHAVVGHGMVQHVGAGHAQPAARVHCPQPRAKVGRGQDLREAPRRERAQFDRPVAPHHLQGVQAGVLAVPLVQQRLALPGAGQLVEMGRRMPGRGAGADGQHAFQRAQLGRGAVPAQGQQHQRHRRRQDGEPQGQATDIDQGSAVGMQLGSEAECKGGRHAACIGPGAGHAGIATDGARRAQPDNPA